MNGNTAWRLALWIVLVTIVPTGCRVLIPGTGRSSIPVSIEERLGAHPLVVDEVTVDAFFDPTPIEEDAMFILDVFIDHANADTSIDHDLEPVRLSFHISEERIVKDYVARNSISVEVVGVLEGDATMRGFYSVDADSSIASYRYLQTVLRRTLRFLLPRSRRA